MSHEYFPTKVVTATYFGMPVYGFSHVRVGLHEQEKVATVVYYTKPTEPVGTYYVRHKEPEGAYVKLLKAVEASSYTVHVWAPSKVEQGVLTELGYKETSHLVWSKV